MQAHYINVLKDKNISRDVIFTKVSIDQPEGKTYSIQIVFDGKEQMEQFLENWLPEIEKKLIENYRNRYLCFSSILTELYYGKIDYGDRPRYKFYGICHYPHLR